MNDYLVLFSFVDYQIQYLFFPAGAVYCSGVGFGPGDSDWLKWLCIAFGILFGVMLLINIFLCSAMTCSCTRSEIIEKEPSVYDDYSIYDSQYGEFNEGCVNSTLILD